MQRIYTEHIQHIETWFFLSASWNVNPERLPVIRHKCR
ncbi:hypothetical protein M565_ctg5P1504 [Vibrio cyclitrophicus FF75]|nr:hypothetical protein M565_ctg5P1504 [Vibrio cyclitrophicus FF75]